MAQEGLSGNDRAVSELIGELMVLFITVAVFGLLIAVVNGMMSRPHAEIVTISAANNSSAVLLTHMGGDSVGYATVSVVVNGSPAAYDAEASDANDNGRWDPGEVLRVANPPAGQPLSVIVYDAAAHAALGSFDLR